MKASTLISKQALVAGLIFCGAIQLFSRDMTAFELVEEGNQHLGIEAKGRVVEIRSEKSVGTLTPDIWYIVYYDPDATAMAAEIKFAAGEKVSVKRPARLLEPISGAHKELDRAKLKVDSDRAIEIATQEPLLKNLTLAATELKLERSKEFGTPVWKVEIWAQKLRRPDKDVKVGEVRLSAESGDVLESDLKISRVD